MTSIDQLVKDFLSVNRIAVVGVSTSRPSACNLAYTKFKQSGHQVYAVNPHIDTYEGDPCYPNIQALPEKPEAVFIFANPTVTEKIIADCVDAGVHHVWMHCMLGTKPGLARDSTSVSDKAVAICKAHGINVIPGSCPNQFISPDPFHKLMRNMWNIFGFMPGN